MCLETAGEGLLSSKLWQLSKCPRCHEHQRTTRVRRRRTLKARRRTRPVIIQTFESSSLMSHWFIPLSASPFESSTDCVLSYLLAIRDGPARVCVGTPYWTGKFPSFHLSTRYATTVLRQDSITGLSLLNSNDGTLHCRTDRTVSPSF